MTTHTVYAEGSACQFAFYCAKCDAPEPFHEKGCPENERGENNAR